MKINIDFERKENPVRYARIWRRKYNKLTGNLKRKLADYTYMDKKAGVPVCDYTYREFRYLLLNNTCTYCGSSKALGLDRIDNKYGHTKDNTVVSCLPCNVLRGDRYTPEEMKAIVHLLRKRKELDQEIEDILERIRSNKN